MLRLPLPPRAVFAAALRVLACTVQRGLGCARGVVMPGGARVQAICWWCGGGCSWLVGWLDVWVLPCPPSAVAGLATGVSPSC